jgi:nucleotide-binding universal stress UspA family protein
MPRPIRHLMMGVASLEEPEPLLLAAVALAESLDATLHLVHAYDLPEATFRTYSHDAQVARRFAQQYRDGMRAEVEARVSELTSSSHVRCHALPGEPYQVLCEQAESLGVDLLIVGGSRHGRLLRALLGSSAERVIQRSGVPVLVLRSPIARPLRRVLLTTDMSDLSAATHDRGVELVQSLFPTDAPELRSLLVVWHDLASPTQTGGETLERLARADLDTFLAERPPHELPVTRKVRVGNPAREIAAEAAACDTELVVLGTHGRSGSPRLLLGSVAEATVRQTRGNVLVLPAPRAAPVAAPGGNSTMTGASAP